MADKKIYPNPPPVGSRRYAPKQSRLYRIWLTQQRRRERKPFSPLSLFANGEQGAWYDQSDLTTLFQDAAGTTPVTADGDPVGLMLDKSGNGNHVTQSTTASKPIYRTDGALHWLEFDGVDDFMSVASIDFSASDEMSLCAGVHKADDALGCVMELSANAVTNINAFYFFAGDGGSKKWSSLSRGDAPADAGQASYDTTAGPDTAVITATHSISGDLSTMRRNGAAGTSGTFDKGAGNFGTYPLYLGARNGSTYPLNGNVYGSVVTGRVFTADEIASIEAYMANKSGVTL